MVMATQWIGSCNYTPGRSGYRPEAFVIHIMDDESIANVDAWFNTPKSARNTMPVSAHYGVGRDGSVHQYVHEMDTAWHAGRVNAPSWPLIRSGVNPNRYTIGIEHQGKPADPWTDAMYEATAGLMAAAAQRWSIPLDRDHVVGHCEIYSLKPYCPGPHLDFDQLILLAQSVVLSGADNNWVASPGSVATRTRLNIRLGAPSATAAIVRTAAAGEILPYAGWTSNGESVHGNAHWYADAAGNYFWAGGTEQPIPGVA
jgi:N-acetylmuramoyl-L-alanine amidase